MLTGVVTAKCSSNINQNFKNIFCNKTNGASNMFVIMSKTV